MSLRSRLKLPKEHGAWAMLYVPFVVGLAVAGRFSWAIVCLFISISAFFISRESLLLWWRAERRGRKDNDSFYSMTAYLALAAIAGLPLIFHWRLYWLVPMAIFGLALLMVNGRQAVQMEDRTIAGELTALAGLTLTAPAGYYAATGWMNRVALLLWAFNFLYFASSVFYIKHRIYSLNPKRVEDQKKICRISLAFHSTLLLGLAVLVVTGRLNLMVLAAFTPALFRSFLRIIKPLSQINLTRAGIFEIIYSLLFLLFITLSFIIA
ncbi:MAG: YwiC-like family protein [Acidobacteria bacterium]|nr:YwiC-like family protein [Acidobacteriota bacterium]